MPPILSTKETVQKIALELLEKGFTIISPKNPDSYLTAMIDNHFLSLQYGCSMSAGSVSYVGSKEFGSGQGVFDWEGDITIDHIDRMIYTSTYRINPKIQRYKNLDHYLSKHHWQDLAVTTKDSTRIVPKY